MLWILFLIEEKRNIFLRSKKLLHFFFRFAIVRVKEAFQLSQNERIIVELAANFYNAGLFGMPGFEMVYATCDTAFNLILEAFRLRRAKLFYKDGEVSAEWEERK